MLLNTTVSTLILTLAFNISFGQNKQMKMENGEKVEIQVVSLLADSSDKEKNTITFHAVADSTKTLAMLIGYFEAQTLAVTLEEMKPTAPLPLDLLQNAFIEFGYTIKEVLIDSIKDGIYTSKIICTNSSKTVTLNARTSDAVTLAYKFKCPIYTFRQLMSN